MVPPEYYLNYAYIPHNTIKVGSQYDTSLRCVASRRVALNVVTSYCELANRDAMRRRTTRCKATQE